MPVFMRENGLAPRRWASLFKPWPRRCLGRPANGWLLFLGLLLSCAAPGTASATVVYHTRFEPQEGYSIEADLAGQNNWIKSGSGGNGIVSNFFGGYGQQAYLGYTPPADNSDTLNVWRPINLSPVPANTPLVRFSVLMAYMDSTNGWYDDFRWSVYNTESHRLFSVDFDGVALNINYVLDDGAGFVATGKTFAPGTIYELVILMDFSRNEWSAMLDGQALVNARPISTTGSVLNLGDVDAVWSIRTPGSPGDNYLVFDEYLITAGPAAPTSPELQAVTRLTGGEFLLRLFGDPGLTLVVEGSNDLQNWTPLKTNTIPNDGVFDYLDDGAAGAGLRFYRARQWP